MARRTARQRAALRKAQLASARKRKGKGRKRGNLPKKYGRRVAAVALVGGIGGVAAAYYGDKAVRKYARRKGFKKIGPAARAAAGRNRANREWDRAMGRQRAEDVLYRNRNKRVKSTRGPSSPLRTQLALPRGRS